MPNTIPTPIPDELARERSLTLHYVETLMQWGEAIMRRNSPEAFQQARLMFDTAAKILGKPPRSVEDIDQLASPQTIANFVPQEAPLNPLLLNLYDQASDRLALIHACINAKRLRNGQPNQHLPYWGNSPLRNGWKTTAQTCPDEADWCHPHSCYRFLFLVQKAQELSNEVQSMGAALLAAFEKGDATYLESLRATHEHQLMNLMLEVRQNQCRAADWTLQALQFTQAIAQTHRQYYANLIEAGLNSGEIAYQTLTGVSIASRLASNVLEAVAQILSITPDMWVGSVGPFATTLKWIPSGSKAGGALSIAARITNNLAEIANTSASLSLQQAEFKRRGEGWTHEVEVLDLQSKEIERQILEAERQRHSALRELNNHQRQIEQSAEVLNFLRDKFTNHALYMWLQQETAALHYQMYELALQTARQAERAFNYERGYTTRSFVPTKTWDNLHEGLLAGERLNLALRQMEMAYLNENCREYELTKHFSLRLHFPLAFLQLKATGYCEIEIPEWMFDLDYPGHYMRRIKNVSMTIPCVVGPYMGVNCRLTLLSSTTRKDPHLIDPPATCCRNGKLKNGYEPVPDDPRIVKQYGALQAIATSSGQNDSGMFELNFKDELYLPFEFAGAVSCWRLELRQENNQWDVDTISDVILHLNYTAREGGDVLRRVANEVAQQNLPDAGLRFFDVKRDFSDKWHQFQYSSTAATVPQQLELWLGRHMFAFLASRPNLQINRLTLFIVAPGTEPSAHHLVRFLPNDQHGQMDEHRWKCDAQNIYCIASADWPGLYHGVLDIPLGPLNHEGEQHLGTFRFPPNIDSVCNIFLFCSYSVAANGKATQDTFHPYHPWV